jgi:hypothetical protein
MKVKVIGSQETGTNLVNAETGELIRGVTEITCVVQTGHPVRTVVTFVDCEWSIGAGCVPVMPPANYRPNGMAKAEIVKGSPISYGEGVVLALLDNDMPAGADNAMKVDPPVESVVASATREIVKRFGGG